MFLTVYNGKPATFTICDAAGNQKQFTIQPKFEPASFLKPNYLEIINKDPQPFGTDDASSRYLIRLGHLIPLAAAISKIGGENN